MANMIAKSASLSFGILDESHVISDSTGDTLCRAFDVATLPCLTALEEKLKIEVAAMFVGFLQTQLSIETGKLKIISKLMLGPMETFCS